MTTIIPNSQASGVETYEEMFKEITKKLYGEEATQSLHTPMTHITPDVERSFNNLLSDRNLSANDFDHSGIDSVGSIKSDDHLAAFGLAALMQNGFASPNALLNSHTLQQMNKQNQSNSTTSNDLNTSSNINAAPTHNNGAESTQEKCTSLQHGNDLSTWNLNSKSEVYQHASKHYKSKKHEISHHHANGNANNVNQTQNDGQSGHQKRYNCSSCPYSTDRRDLFTRHENIHKEEKPFHCYVCLKQFNRADHVKKHFLRMHRGLNYDIGRTKRILPQTKSKKSNSSGSGYYNHTSNDHLTNSLSVPATYHSSLQNQHHQQMEPISQPSIIDQTNQHLNSTFHTTPATASSHTNQTQSTIKFEKKLEKSTKKNDKRFMCCYCSWSGNDNWGLKRHLNTHTKPFVCALCDYKAARSERLATHVFKVHNKKVCTKSDSKPPKPAIKSSTLPRTSSQERDWLKPPPPPKPLGLAPVHNNYRPDIALAPEVYNHLRGLQKKAKDLRMEMRTLRRLSQAQAVAVREDIKDAFMGIRATLMASSGSTWGGQGDQEKTRLSREEEMYKQEVIRLEKDLSDLESSVEGLRGEVINRRTRVNMTAVEDMALVLSRASKTVAELKMRFPSLQNGLRNILSNEMEKVVREEKFLKEEPDRLESALRRCKKLTGTLVTLKRLASVQEQRLPCAEPPSDDIPRSADLPATNKPVPSPRLGSVSVSGGIPHENALDALLDELQTFAKPPTGNTERPDDSTSDDSSQTLQSTVTTQLSQTNLYPTEPLSVPNIGLRRLHSYPSGSDTDTSPPQPQRSVGKPPVPERNAELLSKVSNKRIPPPPPPRTSSRSPLASPTSPNVPTRMPSLSESMINDQYNNGNGGDCGNSSGSESNHSQEHGQRQMALELRHQELLKKQKQLQEQYARLQQISKTSALPPADILHLKKTGSESNLPQKMGLNMAISGSMKNLNVDVSIVEAKKNEKNHMESGNVTTTKQVYETDIL